jgi:uncharacterized protein
MPSLLDFQRAFAEALLAPRAASAGVAAYRANVHGNWTQALAGAYPIVRKIVGAEFFDGLAHAYAWEHPSASGDLNEYGARMADFVARFRHTQDLPYLPDVARMEWLAHRAYYAPAPVCALLDSPWPLGRLWTVHQDDYEGEVDVDLRTGPDRILGHRPRWRVLVRSLAPGDFCFLHSLTNGAELGEALEAAAQADASFDVPSALVRWVDAGVLST